jgi:hypothetical protein
MNFDVRGLLTDGDTIESAVLKTRNSFLDYFEDAETIEAVTYSDSPQFLLKAFEELPHVTSIRVLVGRRSLDDYREQLVGKVDIADRLERLRAEGRLDIQLSRGKDVHSKLYRVTTPDGRVRWIDTSANFSKHGWSNQTNSATIFETDPASPLDQKFQSKLAVHFEYGDPFMQDLRERLELTDEDREEVLNLWVGGKISARDPVQDFNGKLLEEADKQVPDSVNLTLNRAETPGLLRVLEEEGHDVTIYTEEEEEEEEVSATESPSTDGGEFAYEVGETKLNLSLVGLPEKSRESVKDLMKAIDIPVVGDTAQPTLSSIERYFDYAYDLPSMRVVETDGQEELIFQADGVKYNLSQPLPEDPAVVDASLIALERYFDTVDKYGNPGGDPTTVKAHLFEALIWFFWAPFANRQAAFYRSEGITGSDLDKALPCLYIYGPSNAGKGKFGRFALSLISKGKVAGALDADEITNTKLGGTKDAQTLFPLLVDDIPKQKIESFIGLRNWWSDWNRGDRYPMFAAISNDTRPKDWFRNRSKILRFEVLFSASTAGAAEVNTLIDEYNPVFEWFAHEYLNTPLEIRDDDDALAEARTALCRLYEYADRPLPDYFPTEPAEDLYDLGRGRWQEAYDLGQFEFTRSNGILFAEFDPDMQTWDVRRYYRDIPSNINAESTGYKIKIRDEDEFEAWLGRSLKAKKTGILARLF